MENIQSNDKIHFNGTLIADFTATGLSVLFLQFLYVFGRVSGAVNWEMVIFDSIIGLTSYWMILLIFRPKSNSNELGLIVFSVVLGSTIWILCHVGYLIYFDWWHLSDIRPETFYERNVWRVKTGLLYIVPITTISSLIFIFLLRSVWRVSKTTSKDC